MVQRARHRQVCWAFPLPSHAGRPRLVSIDNNFLSFYCDIMAQNMQRQQNEGAAYLSALRHDNILMLSVRSLISRSHSGITGHFEGHCIALICLLPHFEQIFVASLMEFDS